MKVKWKSNLSIVSSIAVAVILILGLPGSRPLGLAEAAPIKFDHPNSTSKLEMTQGNLLHYSVMTGEEFTFPLTIQDSVEDEKFSWTVLNPPVNGDVIIALADNGIVVTYTPLSGYTGKDLFTLKVNDKYGDDAQIRVIIDVISPPNMVERFEQTDHSFLSGSYLFNGIKPPAGSKKQPSTDKTQNGTVIEEVNSQRVETILEETDRFTMEEVTLSDGSVVYKNIIKGSPVPPDDVSTHQVNWLDPQVVADAVILSEVPAFTWVFGCSAVSGAMIAGYYDRTGFPDIYTGSSNGGVIPLLGIWGTWLDEVGDNYPNNPLVATKNGVDGRTTRGSIDDYWIEYLNAENDPYITNGWGEHTWGDAIGDYMKTSQSAYGNVDGSTSFYWNGANPVPLTCDVAESENLSDDGTLGIRQFYNARGYSTSSCYLQATNNIVSGGFNLDQYRAEIDAGYPVMIHVEGHTMVGVGYETGTNTIYIHDTWSPSVNSMDWGGKYGDMAMWGVSIVHPTSTSAPDNDEIASPTIIATLPADFSQSTTSATRAVDDPDLTGCNLSFGLASVWYRYSPAKDGVFSVDTFGSNYDTVLGIWSGTPGSLTEVACNDNQSGLQSYLGIPVQAGLDYYIGVSQNNGGINSLGGSNSTGNPNEKTNIKPDDIGTNAGGTLYLHAENSITTSPWMDVVPLFDFVWGHELLPTTEVSLTMGGYSTSATSDSHGEVSFDLSGEIDIVPGSVITIDDGYGNTTTTVTDLAVTSVDETTDQITGTADPYSDIEVYACDINTCEWVFPVTGSAGTWLADFATVPFDLTPGVSGWAMQPDADRNRTVIYWEVPNPLLSVDPQEDFVEGFGWTPDTAVKLVIDGTIIDTRISDGNGYVSFWTSPFNITTGQLVKMTDGFHVRKHIVAKLKVKTINPFADLITGKAVPGSEVYVVAYDPGLQSNVGVIVAANSEGIWQVDFSGSFDIVPGSSGSVSQYDSQGNSTRFHWYLLNPSFGVNPQTNTITGWEWTPGTEVALSLDSYSDSTIVNEEGGFFFDLSAIYDLQPGETVELTDGMTTKTHVIRNLSITEINEMEDVLSGTADPEGEVWVAVGDKSAEPTVRIVETDILGNWQADFSGYEDIGPGTWGVANHGDEDGDLTEVTFNLPDIPKLSSLSSKYAVAGQPDMTLYLNGEDFDPTSVAWWGGVEKDTTYISAGQLSIELNETDLAVPASLDVRVVTPAPGGGISATLNFQVIEITPAYGDQLTSNHVEFDWGDIVDADLYKIQLSSVPDFSIRLLSTKTSASFYAGYLPPLARGNSYYWRIRPFYGDVKGPWSITMQFKAQDPLPAPELGITEISGYNATLNWLPVDDVVKYKLQVSKDAAFTNLIFNAPVFAPETSKILNLPEKMKTYYWRVKAIDVDRFKSSWSVIGTFTVPLD